MWASVAGRNVHRASRQRPRRPRTDVDRAKSSRRIAALGALHVATQFILQYGFARHAVGHSQNLTVPVNEGAPANRHPPRGLTERPGCFIVDFA